MARRGKMKEKFVNALELPRELVLNVPKITVTGKDKILIESYKSLVSYETECVKLSTSVGTLSLFGKDLTIKEITSEDIIVQGKVGKLEFNA
ncbi:MAG TPA: sporulation protein YqfC [Clostridiales bacterium]|nr:sporulation protein YqfC [Clostridiales bacterium]